MNRDGCIYMLLFVFIIAAAIGIVNTVEGLIPIKARYLLLAEDETFSGQITIYVIPCNTRSTARLTFTSLTRDLPERPESISIDEHGIGDIQLPAGYDCYRTDPQHLPVVYVGARDWITQADGLTRCRQ